jgi:uncharacterized membrane protein
VISKKGVVQVNVDVDRLWGLLSDLESLGSLFSEVESVDVINYNNFESIWRFSFRLGFLDLSFDARSRVLELVENRYVHFVVERDYIVIAGAVNLRPMDDSTLVEVELSCSGKGRLKFLVENIFKRRFDEELRSIDKRIVRLCEGVDDV